MRSRWPALALLAITGLAALIRVQRLGRQSFWIDEGISAELADAGFAQWRQDTHPPLYYALLALWRLGGGSDEWLRLFSVLLGVATIPVVYAVGTRLLSRAAGLWAAGLLAVVWIHVRYSQEARMYSLLTLLFACALWGVVVAAREGRTIGWVAYTVAATLLLYTHGLAAVYVAVLAVVFPFLAPPGHPWRWRRWIAAHAIVALCFAPWTLSYLQQARTVVSSFWIPLDSGGEPPLFRTIYDMTVRTILPLSSLLKGRLGLAGGDLLGRWVWFAPVLLLIAWAVVRARSERRRAVSALLALYALPILAITAMSLVLKPVLILRVLLPTLIPLVLLMASAVEAVSPRPRFNHAALAVVAAILLLGTAYHFRFEVREQWREVSRHLQTEARPGDLVVIDTHATHGVVTLDRVARSLLARYDPGRRLKPMRMVAVYEAIDRCTDPPERCLDRMLAPAEAGQRVWLVHSHTRKDEAVQAWMARRFDRADAGPFYGILLEQATLKP